MARGKLSFKKTDVTRAVKAVAAAGVKVARVEVDTAGKIVIIAAGEPESQLAGNELDMWRAKRARSTEGR
jgi:hypothetical protein